MKRCSKRLLAGKIWRLRQGAVNSEAEDESPHNTCRAMATHLDDN